MIANSVESLQSAAAGSGQAGGQARRARHAGSTHPEAVSTTNGHIINQSRGAGWGGGRAGGAQLPLSFCETETIPAFGSARSVFLTAFAPGAGKAKRAEGGVFRREGGGDTQGRGSVFRHEGGGNM